jgi:serpin B
MERMMRRGEIALLVGLIAVGLDLAPGRSGAGQPDPDSLARDNTVFALDLYRGLAGSPGNLFFSPYSISSALAMAYAGARGETESQMAGALHFSMGQGDLHASFAALQATLDAVETSDSLTLAIANSLWPQAGYAIRDEYARLLKQYYGVGVTPVDYHGRAEAARRSINAWVADKTQGHIQDLVPEMGLNEWTRLVLVDAVYFKGTWADAFKPALTKNEPFHITAGESVDTPMMTQKQKLLYGDLDSLEVLQLEYRGNSLSMLILLPRAPYTLERLEAEISEGNLAHWKRVLGRREVSVFLPRFKMNREFRLDKALTAMGMVDAFLPDRADFSGIAARADTLFIGAVFHRAFVEVDEQGTEAAAATGIKVQTLSAEPMPPPPAIFRADHPFLFLIQHNWSGAILFMGRVADPTRG